MRQRPLLRVFILCEVPLDDDVSKKLLDYFRFYEGTIHIDTGTVNPSRKVICIPTPSYNPIFNTEFSYFMKTHDHLYNILLSLVFLAISHLNQNGYHDTGDELTIFVPSTPNDDLSYTFGWRLHY